MTTPKVCFIFDEKKEPDNRLGQSFVAALGQTPMEETGVIAAIGGDGNLLHAMQSARDGAIVIGIVPPGSNSTGFWTNRGIETPEQLLHAVDYVPGYKVRPLQADITFKDGSMVTRYGYNDITIRAVDQTPTPGLKEKFGLTDMDVSVQSMLVNLRVAFANSVLGPARIMGGGLIFSTAFGSTGMNRKYGGPALDIRNEGIILTGIGVENFTPVYNSRDTVFHLDVQSYEKRPVLVTNDSFGIRGPSENPISALQVTVSNQKWVHLVVADDPGTRAYSALMPRI